MQATQDYRNWKIVINRHSYGTIVIGYEITDRGTVNRQVTADNVQSIKCQIDTLVTKETTCVN